MQIKSRPLTTDTFVAGTEKPIAVEARPSWCPRRGVAWHHHLRRKGWSFGIPHVKQSPKLLAFASWTNSLLGVGRVTSGYCLCSLFPGLHSLCCACAAADRHSLDHLSLQPTSLYDREPRGPRDMCAQCLLAVSLTLESKMSM